MLGAKSKTNKEVSSTHVFDKSAQYFLPEYIFKTAMEKLGLDRNHVSEEFQNWLTVSIYNKLKDTMESKKLEDIINIAPISNEAASRISAIAEENYYNKKRSKKVDTVKVISEIVRDKFPDTMCTAVSSIISRTVNENKSVYKEMYINDLLNQFDKFNENEKLDKFFKIYRLIEKECWNSDYSFEKSDKLFKKVYDLDSRYYGKLIKLCNGDKKKFTDFCEKTEGKILSGFEKIAVFITKIVFGFALGYQQLFDYLDYLLEPKEYKPYLKDEYWNENVPSQDNKNKFTEDTSRITQGKIKSKAQKKATLLTRMNGNRRPLSGILNGSIIEMGKLDQNGKKIKPKDEQK